MFCKYKWQKGFTLSNLLIGFLMDIKPAPKKIQGFVFTGPPADAFKETQQLSTSQPDKSKVQSFPEIVIKSDHVCFKSRRCKLCLWMNRWICLLFNSGTDGWCNMPVSYPLVLNCYVFLTTEKLFLVCVWWWWWGYTSIQIIFPPGYMHFVL